MSLLSIGEVGVYGIWPLRPDASPPRRPLQMTRPGRPGGAPICCFTPNSRGVRRPLRLLRLGNRPGRAVLLQSIKSHPRGALAAQRVPGGHDQHPSQKEKRHQTRDGS
jgi:hypothetical protein